MPKAEELHELPALDKGREPIKRCLKSVGSGRPSTSKSLLIGQPSPVVGVGDERTSRLDRLELPPPEMTWWVLARFGGLPCNSPAPFELDNMILPDVPVGDRHAEHLTDLPDALPASRLGQIAVAVPSRLLGRIGNELEDSPITGRDLATGAYDPWNFLVPDHVHIQAQGESGCSGRHRHCP